MVLGSLLETELRHLFEARTDQDAGSCLDTAQLIGSFATAITLVAISTKIDQWWRQSVERRLLEEIKSDNNKQLELVSALKSYTQEEFYSLFRHLPANTETIKKSDYL